MKKKSKQVYGSSGSWNRQLESIWSKLKGAMTLTARTEMMKQGFVALKSGDWEEYKKHLSEKK